MSAQGTEWHEPTESYPYWWANTPAWLEDILTWPTLDDWTPRLDQLELERHVKRRMRIDDQFRAVLAEVMADANLTITVRRWEPENRLLPMPLEYA